MAGVFRLWTRNGTTTQHRSHAEYGRECALGGKLRSEPTKLKYDHPGEQLSELHF